MTTVREVIENAKYVGQQEERLRWKRGLLKLMEEMEGEP
jgi:hypothetical protein